MTTDDRTGTAGDLAPDRPSPPPAGTPTIRHVLVPLDGSAASAHAVANAAAPTDAHPAVGA